MRMKSEKAGDLVKRCYCHCGKLKIATPSGAVCEDHRLSLGVTEADVNQAPLAKRLIESTRAVRVGRGKYLIGETVYSRAIKREPTVKAVLCLGEYLIDAGFIPLKKQPT